MDAFPNYRAPTRDDLELFKILISDFLRKLFTSEIDEFWEQNDIENKSNYLLPIDSELDLSWYGEKSDQPFFEIKWSEISWNSRVMLHIFMEIKELPVIAMDINFIRDYSLMQVLEYEFIFDDDPKLDKLKKARFLTLEKALKQHHEEKKNY